MLRRSLLLSAFVLSSILGGAPRSFAAADDPVNFVTELGSRALAAMGNGDTAAATQIRFRQLFRQYFDVESCARSALGAYWLKATAPQRKEFVELYEDYVVIGYSATSARSVAKASKSWGATPIRERSS